jgi:hypothetical protein
MWCEGEMKKMAQCYKKAKRVGQEGLKELEFFMPHFKISL